MSVILIVVLMSCKSANIPKYNEIKVNKTTNNYSMKLNKCDAG